MEQSSTWETYNRESGHEVSNFNGTRMFITMFIRARH
jgi:hypothetical protein